MEGRAASTPLTTEKVGAANDMESVNVERRQLSRVLGINRVNRDGDHRVWGRLGHIDGRKVVGLQTTSTMV